MGARVRVGGRAQRWGRDLRTCRRGRLPPRRGGGPGGGGAARPCPTRAGAWVVTVPVNVRRDPSFRRSPIDSLDAGEAIVQRRGFFRSLMVGCAPPRPLVCLRRVTAPRRFWCSTRWRAIGRRGSW